MSNKFWPEQWAASARRGGEAQVAVPARDLHSGRHVGAVDQSVRWRGLQGALAGLDAARVVLVGVVKRMEAEAEREALNALVMARLRGDTP
jgi:hypothetical protein